MSPDLGRRDRMVAMYQRHVPVAEIAREFGVRPNSVRTALTRAGVCERLTRSAPSTVEQMNMLADLMSDGCPSVSEAARRMGMKQSRTDQLWQRIRSGLGEQAA